VNVALTFPLSYHSRAVLLEFFGRPSIQNLLIKGAVCSSLMEKIPLNGNLCYLGSQKTIRPCTSI